MDYLTFNKLSDKGKCFHIKNNGTYLATRKESGCWINLYSINHFFAEVWFQLVDNKIVFVNTLEASSAMDKYLEKIDISDLIDA
ncbi:hypothetical protein QQ020_22365 [Fulvivirgaceae bacterium BMA12]|uniref:Uncharacterized protein n=1 Tax=Agaribacillus aureus TaxID=3051825 RepID=A0ABT8LCR4_9BACT|nr:hypothetical protein [Fulvivirgaceae bacterium BMA12]